MVCIASGPSLTAEDCEAVRQTGLPSIVVNTSFRLCPWADVLYAMDKQWWQHYGKEVARTFPGKRVSVRRLDGVIRVAGLMHTYNNSGAGAVSLAKLMGARRILLLGYDVSLDNGKAHWHPDHGGTLKNCGTMHKWAASFEILRKRLEKSGIEHLNCSRRTELDWPRCDLTSALAKR